MEKKILNVSQAAKCLGVTRPEVYQMIRDGKLAAHGTVHHVLISVADIESYLQKHFEDTEKWT